ncbi:MAG TPA: protein kinase [Pseudonocardia sp.]|jgi:serine/threonine-protein kinase|nr:protein kinase [Pseudonocardia sp.]
MNVEVAAQQQFGPYRLDRLLGRGGMGEVFQAYHTEQNRVVALKLLLDELGEDDEYRRRFLRESQVTARLTDPHVIPIHSWGAIDNRLYLEMRYIDGEDLGDLLDRDGPLPPLLAIGIVSQIAGALDAAHRVRLVHRDVKPSNILLSRDESGRGVFAYLMDFGIARTISGEASTALTRIGTALGSLDYMAPERFLEQPVDARTDVYALGCVLYKCLTGERPFPVDGMGPRMNAHLVSPPPRPSTHRAGLPPALDQVVVKAMAKRPDERYPSAGALAAAARQMMGPGPLVQPVGRPSADRPPAAHPRAGRPPAPRPSTPRPSTPGPRCSAPAARSRPATSAVRPPNAGPANRYLPTVRPARPPSTASPSSPIVPAPAITPPSWQNANPPPRRRRWWLIALLFVAALLAVVYYLFGTELLALLPLDSGEPDSSFSRGIDPGVPVGDAIADQPSGIRLQAVV